MREFPQQSLSRFADRLGVIAIETGCQRVRRSRTKTIFGRAVRVFDWTRASQDDLRVSSMHVTMEAQNRHYDLRRYVVDLSSGRIALKSAPTLLGREWNWTLRGSDEALVEASLLGLFG